MLLQNIFICVALSLIDSIDAGHQSQSSSPEMRPKTPVQTITATAVNRRSPSGSPSVYHSANSFSSSGSSSDASTPSYEYRDLRDLASSESMRKELQSALIQLQQRQGSRRFPRKVPSANHSPAHNYGNFPLGIRSA